MGVGVLSFLIIWKTVRTCLFAMVFLVREGFDQVVQKRKKIKIGPCATTFMGLEGFYGGWKVGGVH